MLPSSIGTPLAMAFSLFVVFPLLMLFALPLFILGVVTVFCSFAALFLRASLVYIELSVALARSYLLAAPEPSSSFNLKVSGEAPSSPSRSYARGLRRSHQYRPPQSIRTISPVRRDKVRRRRSAGCVEGSLGGGKTGTASHQHRASLPMPVGLRALTSGDQNRDFEGIGGWRTGSPSKPGFQPCSYPTTPGDEADDRTWISFNRRLELPSFANPYVTRGTVTATSHGLGLSAGGAEEDAEGGREGRIWFPTSSLSSPGVRRKRHHKRSATTSAIPHNNRGETPSNPHPQQRHQNSGSATWQASHRGSPLIAFVNRAPENLPSEGYFSFSRGENGIYTTPSSTEIANIGKSMDRAHRRSLSTRTGK